MRSRSKPQSWHASSLAHLEAHKLVQCLQRSHNWGVYCNWGLLDCEGVRTVWSQGWRWVSFWDWLKGNEVTALGKENSDMGIWISSSEVFCLGESISYIYEWVLQGSISLLVWLPIFDDWNQVWHNQAELNGTWTLSRARASSSICVRDCQEVAKGAFIAFIRWWPRTWATWLMTDHTSPSGCISIVATRTPELRTRAIWHHKWEPRTSMVRRWTSLAVRATNVAITRGFTVLVRLWQLTKLTGPS